MPPVTTTIKPMATIDKTVKAEVSTGILTKNQKSRVKKQDKAT
jgi:hypothetical protein